ncbi:hypothetical protein Agub_g4522, partial [Astrephomene gubernaculifera]
MFAACKAAFSGLGQAGGSSRLSSGSGPGSSSSGPCPTDKQLEAFAKALTEPDPDQISSLVSQCRQLLLLPLKCHPARSTAWHLAAAAPPASCREGAAGAGAGLLRLLLRLYRQQGQEEAGGGIMGVAVVGPPGGLAEVLSMTNKRGHTCLHTAAARGNAEAVRLILQQYDNNPSTNRSSSISSSSPCRTATTTPIAAELLRPDKVGRTA